MGYKVSVVVPCYNVTEIDSQQDNIFMKSVESVRNQTMGYENIEHIFIDDGSTDNTREILEKLDDMYSNVKLLTIDENTGEPSIPRNLGIKEATSEYVMMLDCDDLYVADACEVLYNLAKEYDADMVSSRYYVNTEDTLNRSFLDNYDDLIVLDSIHDFPEVIYTAANTTLWNKIYKKDFLIKNEIKLKEFLLPEDLIFAMECFCKSSKTILINQPIYIYMVNENSFSNRGILSTERFMAGYDFIKEYLTKEGLYNKNILGELIVSELRGILYCNLPNKEIIKMLDTIKEPLNDYSITTRLVNNVSLPLNIIINCFVKLSSFTNVIPLMAKKLIGK